MSYVPVDKAGAVQKRVRHAVFVVVFGHPQQKKKKKMFLIKQLLPDF